MMYYKITRNNTVVNATENLQYVYRSRSGMILIGNEENGQGVLSHDSSTIYQLSGKKPLHGDYPEVTLEEIDADEYKRLRDLLDGVEQEPTPSAVTETDEEPQEEVKEPMSIAEMREKIVKLESSLEYLTNSIDFLTTMLGSKNNTK